MKDWFTTHQALVGMCIVGCATVGAALAGAFKTKGDRYALIPQLRQSIRPYSLWILLVIICSGFSVFGAWLTKQAGEKQAQEAHRLALQTAGQLQEMAVKLDAAKHATSESLTEAKINALKGEFKDIANNLASNLPHEKAVFSDLKKQLDQKRKAEADAIVRDQIQRSGECHPIFSLVVRFTQEAVRTRTRKRNRFDERRN